MDDPPRSAPNPSTTRPIAQLQLQPAAPPSKRPSVFPTVVREEVTRAPDSRVDDAPRTGLDLRGSVTFSLGRGRVDLAVSQGEAKGHGEADSARAAIVPLNALVEIARSAGLEAARALGASVGVLTGERARAALGGVADVRAATMEQVVEVLAGSLALSGLGALSMERWGRAMIVRIEGAPIGGFEVESMLEGAIEAAITAASGRGVAATTVTSEGGRMRLFIGRHATAERFVDGRRRGVAWTQTLAELHDAKGAAR